MKIFSISFVAIGIIFLLAAVGCFCYWLSQEENGLGMAFIVASAAFVCLGGFLMQFVQGD